MFHGSMCLCLPVPLCPSLCLILCVCVSVCLSLSLSLSRSLALALALTAYATMRARGASPSSRALRRDANMTAAAPSLTWLLLPAVVDPSGLNAGLSFASDAAVASARTPSSCAMAGPGWRSSSSSWQRRNADGWQREVWEDMKRDDVRMRVCVCAWGCAKVRVRGKKSLSLAQCSCCWSRAQESVCTTLRFLAVCWVLFPPPSHERVRQVRRATAP